MIGANICMFMLYIHVYKGIRFKSVDSAKIVTYIAGSVLMILSLAACFTGYILVCGQMSYWAMIVIFNLFTVLPVIDDAIISTILAGTYPCTVTIYRLFALHYCVAVLILICIYIHLMVIHRARPCTVQCTNDNNFTLLEVVLKDLMLLPYISVVVMPWLIVLIHPDNWQMYDLISTPPHIEPETYFLWLFCLLKTRASKISGVRTYMRSRDSIFKCSTFYMNMVYKFIVVHLNYNSL
jgi:ubiquinol-cytochrome c reductase cytochrome b subunit